MNTMRRLVLIVSLPLVICVAGLGFWFMTEPQVDAESSEAKQCREYLEQLEMLNRYKLFWTFIQRRLAYSNCIERLGGGRNQPKEDHPISQ
jgi:hypothetical protein